MKAASKGVVIARVFLGLAFVVFGLNGFLQFIPMPAPPEKAGAFLGALAATGYMFPLIKGTELFAGLALGTDYGAASIYAAGKPQGFAETAYAYMSQANNNGSAFAGYTGYYQPEAGNLGAHGITFADLLGGITPATRSAAWSKNLWSFGTRYNADPGLAFYGNVGTSFMAPAAKQIGGTVAVPTASGELPNPGLKPETGVGRDVGVNWRASQALTLDLRGFLNTINDAIVTNIVSAAPSQVRSENAGKARAMGYEVDLRYAASSETSVFGNLTRTHTRVTDPTNADHDGTAIPFAPDTLANAGVLASLPGDMSVATYYHWVGRYYDSTSRSARLGFGQYGVVNVRVQKPLYRDARAAVHLTVDLNNLTDRHHAMPFDFRDPGFNGFAGVDVRY